MTRDYYTYFYFDPRNGMPIYVGKGKGNRAWGHHLPGVRTKIAYAIRKRKLEGYAVEPIIIPMPTEAEALQLEIFFIAYYGRADLGEGTLFNFTDGGEGCSGAKFPDRTMSEEGREKCRNNPNYKNRTPWNKDKKGVQQAWNKGIPNLPRRQRPPCSEETKAKIAAKRALQVITPESRLKATATRLANKNKDKSNAE